MTSRDSPNVTGPAQTGWPLSPITGGRDVTLVDQIPASDIVAVYREIGIHVAHLFTDLDFVAVYRCNATGYRFYHPHSLAATPEFYAEMYKTRPYYAEWRWEHDQALKHLRGASTVLEVGAGNGHFLARITTHLPLKAHGLEWNLPALQDAQRRGLFVENRSIEELAREREGSFDAICAFQVLEHVPDVARFLGAMIDALKSGGRLIVGVPNNNPYLFRYDRLHALNLPPHHMGLWDKGALAALAEIYPLRLVRLEVEPLFAPEYFLDVYLRHIRTSRPLAHALLSRWPPRAIKYLHLYLRRTVEGRNLFAVFEKCSAGDR